MVILGSLISNPSSHPSEALGYFYNLLLKSFIATNIGLTYKNTVDTKFDHILLLVQENPSLHLNIINCFRENKMHILHNGSAVTL